MKCIKCKSILADDAKFCCECGTKVEAEIICPNCKTKNQPTSKFRTQCGNGLLTKDLKGKDEKVVLGNEFILEFNNIYYEKLLKRIELFNDAVDPHTSVRTMDSKILENEYNLSVKKCFEYLISSTKSELLKNDIDLIREKEKIFLAETSSDLFRLLSELNLLTNLVIQNVSNSTTEGIVKGLKAGAAGAAIIPGVGTVLGGIISAASGWIAGDKIDKEEQQILDRWNNQYELVIEQFDVLWARLCELLDEIAETTSIHFEIDENVLKENEKKNTNPIQDIIESNLQNLVDEDDETIFFFHSEIPANKKAGAKSSYVNLDEDEIIICLYDSTVFGGAKEGICLTNKAIYWKEIFEDGKYIGYTDIDKITYQNSELFINGEKVESCPGAKELKKTLDEIVKAINHGSSSVLVVLRRFLWRSGQFGGSLK